MAADTARSCRGCRSDAAGPKRRRSGCQPPAVDEAALAEMGQVISDARAEIIRLVQLGELQNDPIRHPI